jgi:hypothetical protein
LPPPRKDILNLPHLADRWFVFDSIDDRLAILGVWPVFGRFDCGGFCVLDSFPDGAEEARETDSFLLNPRDDRAWFEDDRFDAEVLLDNNGRDMRRLPLPLLPLAAREDADPGGGRTISEDRLLGLLFAGLGAP